MPASCRSRTFRGFDHAIRNFRFGPGQHRLHHGRNEVLARAGPGLERHEGVRHADTTGVCPFAIVAASDADTHVALYAFDLLGQCGSSPDAVALLVHEVEDLSQAGSPPIPAVSQAQSADEVAGAIANVICAGESDAFCATPS